MNCQILEISNCQLRLRDITTATGRVRSKIGHKQPLLFNKNNLLLLILYKNKLARQQIMQGWTLCLPWWRGWWPRSVSTVPTINRDNYTSVKLCATSESLTFQYTCTAKWNTVIQPVATTQQKSLWILEHNPSCFFLRNSQFITQICHTNENSILCNFLSSGDFFSWPWEMV